MNREEKLQRKRDRRKEAYRLHPEKEREASRKWAEANKDKIRENKKDYHLKNRDRIRERNKQFDLIHPGYIQERNKRYRQKNLERIRKREKEYREAHPEQTKILKKRDYEKHRETRIARRKQLARSRPEYEKEVDLKRHYGITLTIRNQMEKDQFGKCAICGEIPKRLVVDHDHKTRKVRKLLCHRCNVVLGFVKEDIRLLRRLSLYIRMFSENMSLKQMPLFEDREV